MHRDRFTDSSSFAPSFASPTPSSASPSIPSRDAPLVALGFDSHWQAAFTALAGDDPALLVARVVAADRELLRVGTAHGETDAVVPGRLLYRAGSAMELPCTGDWLLVRRTRGGETLTSGEPLVVEAVLPRRTVLVRRAAGRRSEPQALAANVDTALLVAGLDGDFNARRLERWLALVKEAGAASVVVLTKRDLCADLASLVTTAQAIAAPAPVVAVDARGGEGVQALRPWLVPGRTLALLGSSGVGKSTLANRLAGEERVATGAVAADGRGRHTTTRRELVPLASGALLLDTPGLREVGLWLGEEPIAGVFPEIAALAGRCRFRDCTHEREPGCAVRAAVKAGELDGARVAALRALVAERAALARRTDDRAARDEKQRVKALHRAARKHRPREM